MFLTLYGLSSQLVLTIIIVSHQECLEMPKGYLQMLSLSFGERFEEFHCELYEEDNAVMLPGRIPGYNNEDIKLLLCHQTKVPFGVRWRQ